MFMIPLLRFLRSAFGVAIISEISDFAELIRSIYVCRISTGFDKSLISSGSIRFSSSTWANLGGETSDKGVTNLSYFAH